MRKQDKALSVNSVRAAVFLLGVIMGLPGVFQTASATTIRPQYETKMRSLIQEGEQAKAESNFDKAIELCRRAVELDSHRVRPRETYMAEECIHKARVGRRNLARSFLVEGHAQRRQEQLLQARAAYAEAMRIDPDYPAAKSMFLEVQQQLLEQAEEHFERAVVLEKSRNLELAITHLKQVQELVGDPNDPLYKKAENRLRDLTGD